MAHDTLGLLTARPVMAHDTLGLLMSQLLPTISSADGKSKVVPVQTTKAYKGMEDIAPFILNLGLRLSRKRY